MGVYQKLFAKFYDPFMHNFEHKLYKRRKSLLSNISGTILGVGEGTGVNFKFYNPEATVLAVEPSEYMLAKAKSKAKGKPNIQLLNYGINEAALNTKIAPKSIDAIVCTLVLCTIDDPEQAIQNFKKWLKPTGKLVILEHIHAKKNINKSIQNIVNPAWNIFADGCNLNRSTDELIKKAGFTPVWEEYFTKTLRFYTGEFKLG